MPEFFKNYVYEDYVILHIALHFIVPALVAVAISRRDFLRLYGLMMVTMLVDLDHLLADPIYDPQRCSIGFHPLHKTLPILIYVIMSFIPKLRWLGVGLLIHMVLDASDCL